MTKSKEYKRQQAELLGMPVGTAERKLRKAIIYELAQQLQKNNCLECGLAISDPDDFAVVHVEDWQCQCMGIHFCHLHPFFKIA